jgi:hypothetical protein
MAIRFHLFSRPVCFLLISLLSQTVFAQQWTTSGTNIYNANTGNIGIGTTTPQMKLDINYTGSGSDVFTAFKSPNAGGANILEVKENNWVGLWRVYCTNAGRGMWWYGNSTTTDYGSINMTSINNEQYNTGIRALVDIGNFTIGNTSSTGNITFNNLSIDPTISNSTGTTLVRGIYYNPTLTATGGTFSNVAYENVSGNNLLNSTSGNTRVGGGADNGNKFQINGTLWSSGFILPTGAAVGKVLTSDAGGNATWQTATGGSSGWALTGNAAVNPATTFVGTTDNSSVAFRTGNLEHMRIDGTTGFVGIGETAPQSLLAVKGTITAQKVVVTQTGWADYVFQPNYQLLPLKDLSKYIGVNQHLPKVPSSVEISIKGDDLGANQAVLLEKIEELTLYLIKENQELDQQNKVLNAQQLRISTLERLLGQTKK